jgi:hypothetical protein
MEKPTLVGEELERVAEEQVRNTVENYFDYTAEEKRILIDQWIEGYNFSVLMKSISK